MSHALTILDGDDPGTQVSKLRAFEIIFAMVVGTEYWARAIPKWQGLSDFYVASLAIASVCCAAICTTRWRRAGFIVLATTHAALIWSEFPATGNHAYLELVFCLLASTTDPRIPADRQLVGRAVRWIVCVVFFYGGVQKLVHGYYWQGQYLAYSLSTEHFQVVMRYLLSADDFARLSSYRGQIGDGPYLLTSPLAVFASVAICVVEIALAPLLLWARTRGLAVLAAIVFLIGVEVAAREVFFGLVFANAILLFIPGDLNRKLIPAFAALLAALLLVRVGVLPEVVFY